MMLHVGKYRHMSAHISVSICADTCQHADKVQIIGIRGGENDVTCRHMSTCYQMSKHADMCRHMCADILAVTFARNLKLSQMRVLDI